MKCLIIANATVFTLASVAFSATAETKLFGRTLGNTPAKYDNKDTFPWINTKAPKGGTLTLGSPSSFDSVNPFTVKGSASPSITNYLDCGLIFEGLACSSNDEPIDEYAHIASKWEEAPDGLSSIFTLNPKAKFSDSKPVSVDDVIFSFEIVRSEKGNPKSKAYYEDIKKIIKIDNNTIKFEYSKKNPELTSIITQQPIIPKHFYTNGDFTKDFATKAIGTGPYILKKFEPGKYIELEKNPNYWAKNELLMIGSYNYDKIIMKLFKDYAVYLQAFIAGEFDVMPVSSAKHWAVDLTGDKFNKNYILKIVPEDKGNKGFQGFWMNTRKSLFKDINVRKALALALDFENMNKTLFYGQYFANDSMYSNSEFAATGLPSEEEKKLLNKWKDKIPEAVYTIPMGKPLGAGLDLRARLTEGKKLLDMAGLTMKDGIYTTKNGEKLEFTILLNDTPMQRVIEPYINNLKQLGIKAHIQMVDDSVYEKKTTVFDFDMISFSLLQSDSLGNEQTDFWTSFSANKNGSYNFAGINSPAIDDLVDKVTTAPNKTELIIVSKALDRVLWHSHYAVPNWYAKLQRTALWNKLDFPISLSNNINVYYHIIKHGWLDNSKEKMLLEAKAQNKALPVGTYPYMWKNK